MDKLISYNRLREAIISDEYQPSEESDDYVAGWIEAWNTVCDIINSQPVAYNVDEVIEKLNKTKGMCGHLCCENVIDVVIA